MRILARSWIVVVSGLLSCAPTAPPVNKVRLKSDVHVLEAAALANVRAFEPDAGVLTLAAGLTVKPGEVLVAGLSTATPVGLLRRVTSISADGARVETAQASLADVVAEGVISVDRPLTGDDLRSVEPHVQGVAPLTRDKKTYATSGGVVLGINDVLLEDVDGDLATKDDQLRLTASLTIEPRVKFTFDFTVLPPGLNEASVTLGVKNALAYRLTGGEGVSKTIDPISLGSLVYAPIVIDVGFPLVFVPKIELVVGADAHLGVSFASEAVAQVDGTIGVGYVDGSFKTIHDFTPTTSTNTANVAGDLYAEVWAGPDFGLSIYGVAGPHLGLHGFARFEADTTHTPCWALSVGAEVTAGIDLSGVSILGLSLPDWEADVFESSAELLNGTCDPSVEGLNPNGVTFGRALSAPKDLDFRGATGLPDGSLVIVSTDPDGSWVTRVRPDGSLSFQRHLAGTFGASRVAVGADGRLFVAGKLGGLQPWLAHLDLDGNLLWSQVYDTSVSTVAGLVATPEGGAILSGTYLTPGSSYAEYLLRVSPKGAVLWANGYDVGFEAKELRRTGDTLALVGWTSYQGNGAGHLTRLDFDGNVLWNRTASGALQYLNGVDVDLPTGTLAVVGTGIDGAAYLNVSAAGDLTHSELVYDRKNRSLSLRFDAVHNAPGGFIAVGAQDFGAAADALAVQFGSNGNPVWADTYGGADNDGFTGLVVNLAASGPNAGVWLLGNSQSLGPTRSHFVVRASATGQVDLTAKVARSVFMGNVDTPGTVLGLGEKLDALVFAAVPVTRTPLTIAVLAGSAPPVSTPATLTVTPLSAH